MEPYVGSVIVPKVVKKQFSNIMLNQLETDPVSCTLYSTWNVLGNLTGKTLSAEVRKETFDRMVSDGKMRPGFGALLDDGMRYALDAFNSHFGTSYKPTKILLSENSILSALDHSGIATGIKFSSKYFDDEQSDGRVESPISEISGNAGHSISIIKANTTDPSIGFQFKIQENYAGRLVYNVIYFKDFQTYAPMFFRT